MSSPLKQNTTTIQNLIDTINSLPDAGVNLPELSNPAAPEELFANKELIDSNGNVVTGTFTIDSELSTQDSLISQIQSVVNELPEAGSGGGNLNTCTIHVSAESPLQGGGYIAVTQWVDGNIVPSVYGWFTNTSSTIENVVCGSAITACEVVDCVGSAHLSDNMTFLECDGYLITDLNIFVAITAPTEPNAVGEIRFQ